MTPTCSRCGEQIIWNSSDDDNPYKHVNLALDDDHEPRRA